MNNQFLKQDAMEEVVRILEIRGSSLKHRKCCIGFDGYIDTLFRIIKSRENNGTLGFYNTIEEFGERILKASGKSADTGIYPVQQRAGGNAPIFANTLSTLGTAARCIALMGYPEIKGPFAGLSSDCERISLGEPCETYAFEFDDGKLMFGNTANADELSWNGLINRVGLERLKEIFAESELVGLVNWSGLAGMNGILDGIVDTVLPAIDRETLKRKLFFFDIADPTARSREDFMHLAKIMAKICEKSLVMLGLNENEALQIHQFVAPGSSENDLIGVCMKLTDFLGISALIVHLRDGAYAFTKKGFVESKGFFVGKPVLTTGGGDNFNGGFCTGQLLGMDMDQSLLLGNAVSSYYVANGRSPDLESIITYISNFSREVDQE